jgi:hypothetical protein
MWLSNGDAIEYEFLRQSDIKTYLAKFEQLIKAQPKK